MQTLAHLPHFADAVPKKAVFILRDHSHSPSDDHSQCEHCGHIRAASYGDKPRSNKVGITATIVLHLLVLLLLLIRNTVETHSAPPAGVEIMLAAPKASKPTPKQVERKPKPKQAPKAAVTDIRRLANTIHPPDEKPIEVKPVPNLVAAPTEDFEARIAERRKQRAAAAQSDNAAPEETEGERAARIGKANIAAANGKSAGSDRDDSGGMFSIVSQSFHGAEVKFRTWNPNFKRKWSTQVTVELGNEPDIETAIVKKMIEMIRKEKPGDFTWDSRRLGRAVPMSARVADTAELQAFLMLEMFPNRRSH